MIDNSQGNLSDTFKIWLGVAVCWNRGHICGTCRQKNKNLARFAWKSGGLIRNIVDNDVIFE
jgi:hypothetical protein